MWVAAIRAAVQRAGGAGVQLTAPGDSRAKAVAVRRAAQALAERGEIVLRRERVDGRLRLIAYPARPQVRVVGVTPVGGNGGRSGPRVTGVAASMRAAADPRWLAWTRGQFRPDSRQHSSPELPNPSKGTQNGQDN